MECNNGISLIKESLISTLGVEMIVYIDESRNIKFALLHIYSQEYLKTRYSYLYHKIYMLKLAFYKLTLKTISYFWNK